MFTTRTNIKARKTYRCYFCREPIQAGTTYVRQFASDGGDIFTSKSHPECDEWACANWEDSDWECFSSGDDFKRPTRLQGANKP
jgi:hypothetical protein